jgi:hypothetical protein
MEYDQLYDESPYVTKDVPRRGGTSIMNTIRATFLICATILASVFAIIFYGYQQDQYVVTSNGAFVSIFDRKSRTINICDKGNCNLLTPIFDSYPHTAPGMAPRGTPTLQQGAQTASRLLGTFPQPQGQQGNAPAAGQPQVTGGNPQMAGGNPQAAGGNPQMTGGNPQMNQQTPGQQQAPGANPQAQQMMQQLMQMQAMAQQMDSQPMSPQKIQTIRQRRMLEDQALANNLLNPQMVQQIRQRRTMEDQQMAQMQQGANPQTVSGTPQAAQAQATGGAAAPAAPAAEASGEEAAADETATDESGTTEEAAPAEDTANAEESPAADEAEEIAPV